MVKTYDLVDVPPVSHGEANMDNVMLPPGGTALMLLFMCLHTADVVIPAVIITRHQALFIITCVTRDLDATPDIKGTDYYHCL